MNTNEEIKLKNSIDKIELEIEFLNFKLKSQKRLITLGSIVLILNLVCTYIKDKLNGLDVFSISLLVVVLHSSIRDYLSTKVNKECEEYKFKRINSIHNEI